MHPHPLRVDLMLVGQRCQLDLATVQELYTIRYRRSWTRNNTHQSGKVAESEKAAQTDQGHELKRFPEPQYPRCSLPKDTTLCSPHHWNAQHMQLCPWGKVKKWQRVRTLHRQVEVAN